jgi:hypothetical protein
MADATARGWGSGWPTDRRRDMAKATGGGITVLVHKEIAPIVRWLLNETVRRGYHLRSGQCWGYANRAIAGTRRPSNHSWGLAVDLNAPSNPQSRDLVTDMPTWLPGLWKAWGFRWGGDYQGLKDPMHLEFMGSPDTARELTARIGNDQAAVVLPPPAVAAFPGGEDHMLRYDLQISLDDKGRGHLPTPLDVPADMVVSLVAHGPYPPVDGYWDTPVLGKQAREGGTMVTATEGPPGQTVAVTLWALDR